MVDLVRRAHAVARDAAAVVGSGPRAAGMIVHLFAAMNIWFWAIVGVPTLLTGVYFLGIASDLYTSEVKFLVRGPGKAAGGLGAMLTSAGIPGGSEDTSAVHEFIMSRDAVRRLDQENNLRAVLSRPESDAISRYPGIWFWRKDFEALFSAYSRFVSVEVDSASGVSTLLVKAYRPEDAQMIARALLSYSEQLINQLNERARQDALGTFKREIATAETQIAKIQGDLTAYRVKQKMLDPKTAALGPLELLGQMNGQLANTKAQLADALKNSPHSPQLPLLRNRIASLERLIAEERAKVTGDTNSVVASVTEFERLDLQRQLGERQLTSAFASLEAARLEAQRQQLYLETITQPNLSDYPLFPRRISTFATIMASCLLAYGIAWLLVAGVREHAAA